MYIYSSLFLYRKYRHLSTVRVYCYHIKVINSLKIYWKSLLSHIYRLEFSITENYVDKAYIFCGVLSWLWLGFMDCLQSSSTLSVAGQWSRPPRPSSTPFRPLLAAECRVAHAAEKLCRAWSTPLIVSTRIGMKTMCIMACRKEPFSLIPKLLKDQRRPAIGHSIRTPRWRSGRNLYFLRHMTNNFSSWRNCQRNGLLIKPESFTKSSLVTISISFRSTSVYSGSHLDQANKRYSALGGSAHLKQIKCGTFVTKDSIPLVEYISIAVSLIKTYF